MKESEKIYQEFLIYKTNNNKHIYSMLCINDRDNPVEKQKQEKINPLKERNLM